MKKKCVMAAMIVLAMGMTACSLELKKGAAAPEATVESKTAGEENPGTETVKTETPGTENPGTENPETGNPETENPETETMKTGTAGTEVVKTETPETKAATDDGNVAPSIEEIMEGDPLVAMVDRYGDNIIVLRDLDDEDIIYYFSTQDAQVVEGDSPIAAGDIVEVTYRGAQGDEEHPGMAVKIVAESMMYR